MKLNKTDWIYFLVHLLLISVGSIVILLGSGNTVAFAVGTSIIATGCAALVTFIYAKFNETTRRRLSLLQQFGFTDAFQVRGFSIASEYKKRLVRARRNIDIIGFGLDSFLADFRDHFSEWKERAHVRILLIDPSFPIPEYSYADQRDREEGRTVGTIRNEVDRFIEESRAALGTSPRGSFSLRLYRCLPTLNIFRIDNEIFWGPYLARRLSRNTPTFLVGRGELYETLVEHFDAIWNNDALSRSVE